MTAMTIEQRIDKIRRVIPAVVRKRMRSLEYVIRESAMCGANMEFLNNCADQLIDLLKYSEKVASIKCIRCPARGTDLIHLRCQYVCKVQIPALGEEVK